MAVVACSRVTFTFYLKVIPVACSVVSPSTTFYHIESLHPPEHPVTAVVLRETTNETLSRMLGLVLDSFVSALRSLRDF
jgi:hypothetical protein